jgi:hypothetical protein
MKNNDLTAKDLPSSGEFPEIEVSLGKNGFIRRKLPLSKIDVDKLNNAEKQRGKLLRLRWCVTESVKKDPEVAVLPSYKRIPARDEILKGKYGGDPPSPGHSLMVSHTKLMADFVTDIKSDPELILIWNTTEGEAAVEAQATDLMVEFGLNGDDYVTYRDASKAVDAAIDLYNNNTSKPGLTIDPKVILAERIKRDKSILAACSNCQYLIVLFMDWGMLPARYTRRIDLSGLGEDRKAINDKKKEMLYAYRKKAMDAYRQLKSEGSEVTFAFEKWNEDYLGTL